MRAKAKTSDDRGAASYYCGPVEFESWTAEKPITVLWKMMTSIPHLLWLELGVTVTVDDTIGR